MTVSWNFEFERPNTESQAIQNPRGSDGASGTTRIMFERQEASGAAIAFWL